MLRDEPPANLNGRSFASTGQEAGVNLSLLLLIIETQWAHLGPDKGPSARLKIVGGTTDLALRALQLHICQH